MRASSRSCSDTLSVASIVAIAWLTFRPMLSFAVLETKMPPERPWFTWIRCDPASRRSASRSVGRLTPNSRASSFSVPMRSPGLRPLRSTNSRISRAMCSLASSRIGEKRSAEAVLSAGIPEPSVWPPATELSRHQHCAPEDAAASQLVEHVVDRVERVGLHAQRHAPGGVELDHLVEVRPAAHEVADHGLLLRHESHRSEGEVAPVADHRIG